MGKPEIVATLAEDLGITKTKAAEAYATVIDHIVQETLNEGRCNLPGLGVFSLRDRNERSGVGPHGAWTKPAGKNFKFKPATSVKESADAKAGPKKRGRKKKAA